VTAAFIRWNDSIRDCKAQRADVIGDDSERDVDLFLLWIVCRAAATAAPILLRQAVRLPYNRNRRSVILSAQLFDLIKNRAEDVGIVIRNRSGEIGEIPGALHDCGHALE